MSSPTWAHWLTARGNGTFGKTARRKRLRRDRWAAWLVPAIYAACLAAFIADLTSTDTLAFGVFYAPLVGTAVFHRDRRAVWFLTVFASLMVIAGAFFPAIDPDIADLIGNRALSLCAVFATAAFVRHARLAQDRLTEQTMRAEAAERIKAEVLNNLSQEIRGPLYSMLGVLELVAADCRPDQKMALHLVRGGGRRLVMTIDNLVDLTQFEPRSIAIEPFDLGMLLHQTVEASRSGAAARQIGLTLTLPADPIALVLASPWGVRRIVENLLADAITHTAPGGRIAVAVTVAVTGQAHHIRTAITDTGTRPPGTAFSTNGAHSGGADLDRLMPSVMGLALSHRLARAMGARLVFSTTSGEETMARLFLPVARRSEPEGGA